MPQENRTEHAQSQKAQRAPMRLSPADQAMRIDAIVTESHATFDVNGREALYAYPAVEGPATLNIGEVMIVCGEYIAPVPFAAVMNMIRDYRNEQLKLEASAMKSAEHRAELIDARKLGLGKVATKLAENNS